MHNISIKYKILIPVFLVLILSISITSGLNMYKSYTNAKDNLVKIANASIKPIVLTSENAVSGANIMKLKSKDMKTLYKGSEALYISVDGMSNKIAKTVFAPEQPPKKITYTFKSKAFKVEHESISKAIGKNESFKFVGDLLVLRNELKINNKGTVIAVFDASMIDAYLQDIILRTLYIALPLLLLSGVIIYYVSTILIGYVKNLQVGLNNFFGFLNDESRDAQMIPVSSNDEIGKMTEIINENISKIKDNVVADANMISEVTEIANKVRLGHLSNRITENANNKGLQELKNVLNSMLDNMQNNVNALMDVLNSYAKNDYKQQVTTQGIEGSMLKLSHDINSVGTTVVTMLQESKKNGLILEQNADELSSSVESLSSSANQQAASLEETAASLEEITSTIKSNTESIVEMSNYGNRLKGSVEQGNKLAQDTVSAMEEINEQTNAITEAITVIDQIAFQTNILSLNAAVEAATAGEAGKGFAVVAQEVRNLASRSAEAAKEIKDIVEKANVKTNSGKEIASQMINGYEDLNSNISNTLGLIEKVTVSSKEQEQGIVQINESINAIDKITQENASTASNTSIIAKQTKDISRIIVDSVDKKEFGGSDNIQIRSSMTDTNYKGVERRKIEREMKGEPSKTNISRQIIEKTPIQPEENGDDEWENF